MNEDRQVKQRTRDFQERERQLNDQIIEYQRDIQNSNQELDSRIKILHMKDLRCLELEKQVNFHETQLASLHKDNNRMTVKNEAKDNNIQNLIRENEKLQHVIQSITK